MRASERIDEIISRWGRFYEERGFDSAFAFKQARRDLHSMILRTWEAGATFKEIGERLGVSPQRINRLRDRAIEWRPRPTPLEIDLAHRPPRLFETDVIVPIFSNLTADQEFQLRFRGQRASDFMVVAGGGETVRAALRTRGLDPNDYFTSPFFIREEVRS